MKNLLFFMSVALILAGSMICSEPAITQTALSKQQMSHDDSWMTEKWDGNEKPYVAIREGINKDSSTGKLTVSYLLGLEQRWHKDEQSPLTLFRWAFARYRSYGLHPPLPFTPIPDVGAFDEVVSPHSYQYARVRFLTEANITHRRDLMPVGRRLLACNPNDFDVEYGLTTCFHQYLSADEKEAALAYADHLVSKYPNNASVYTTKAGVYFSYWLDHKNKTDARNAIKWYQKYLNHAQAGDSWRTHAQQTITLLQRYT